MRKIQQICLTLAVFTITAGGAFADGNAFTPLNFDTPTTAPKAVPAEASTPKATNPVSNAFSKMISGGKEEAPAANASGPPPIGNSNIQNAILELDNAQVDIRNDLLDYKAKYADVDAQYKLIKNERTMLHRQVVSIEKRIRDIDKAKEKIRKNML